MDNHLRTTPDPTTDTDPRRLEIAIKAPGSGGVGESWYRTNRITGNKVLFTPVIMRMNPADGWIDGLPDGYEIHNCTDGTNWYRVVTKG